MLENIFFKTKMTWKRVIILAILCGIIPGLLMIPRFLLNTSFQQPGITLEFWILMAMYIILNCDTAKEAGIKTFIFFFLSQPLIYLVQVPFSFEGWGLFRYYPLWFIITILTLPGGMIAWYTKKNKWYSVPILMVAMTILCLSLVEFAFSLYNKFPHLLLTCIFITMQLILFPYLLFKDTKKRIITYSLIVMIIGGYSYNYYNYNYNSYTVHTPYLFDYEEPYEVVEFTEHITMDTRKGALDFYYDPKIIPEGYKDTITIKDGSGKEHTLLLEYHYENLIINELD